VCWTVSLATCPCQNACGGGEVYWCEKGDGCGVTGDKEFLEVWKSGRGTVGCETPGSAVSSRNVR